MSSDKKLLWVISYHHACNDGTLMALIAQMPILVKVMNLSYSEVGLLGFGLVITVVVQLIVGRMADKMFSKYMLEIGAALMGASFFMILFVSDFAGLFVAVIAARIGASFYHPVGISWITREYSGSYLDTALGIQSGIGNLGVIIALGSSGFLGEAFGWRMPCVLWAGMNLLAVALGLAIIRGFEVGAPRRTAKAVRSFRSTMLKMGILVGPIATGGAMYQVTSYYGPLNLTAMHGWTAGNADLMFALWIGIGTVTSYYFGALSAKFGKMTILKVGYLVSFGAMLGLFFTSSWILVAGILFVFGALLFLTYPALFAMITAATDEDERGTAFGILFGFQLGGGAIVVYICGVIADIVGSPAYSFIVASILSLISLFALLQWERGRGVSAAG